jgi:hypothetical protein
MALILVRVDGSREQDGGVETVIGGRLLEGS